MGNTYKKQSRKFDDEQYSSRTGKPAKHTNNHKFNGIPITNIWIDEAQYLELPEDDVDLGINKQ
jgi:hypothetical protein